MTGREMLRLQAQRLVDLAEKYPNGTTKALLLRASADIFEHAETAWHGAISDLGIEGEPAPWEKP